LSGCISGRIFFDGQKIDTAIVRICQPVIKQFGRAFRTFFRLTTAGISCLMRYRNMDFDAF
jgi:hypothetical protein